MNSSPRVLGIEGTAWAASAAVYDSETDSTIIESDAYEPDSGGIHPREAAEHMHTAIPQVVEAALDRARELQAEAEGTGSADSAPGDPPVDAVAFSRGPGLGPCLRIVATAARALAGTLDVPLVGVNHMVAHLEIGRHTSGFTDPVCLNASGANAHLLAYRNGRYRVLGETMDTGVGNAIDKFTRHVGWSHPGGPKVEAAAEDGEYVELPYVVKGMDFSFSGIMSAAKAEYDGVSASSEGRSPSDRSSSARRERYEGLDDANGEAVSGQGPREDNTSGGSSDERSESDGGTPVEDVCYGLQETIFAMLTEVSERALSLTGRDELVLGGGVGQNDRLREMLAEMCEARGASFHAPEPRFLRDNAGMIAVLGAKMYAAGETLPIEASRVDPDFRPDQVDVVWRDDDEPTGGDATGTEPAGDTDRTTVDGAEAVVTVDREEGRVTKRRVPKTYRHPELDDRLRRERTAMEARLTNLARRAGVPTPVVRDVDPYESAITFEYVGDRDLRDALTTERVRAVGRYLAAIHDAGFVHGDPTVRNVRVATGSDGGRTDSGAAADRPSLIDFGLGYHTDHVEDYAMDLHVFDQSLVGTADDPAPLREAFRDAYRRAGDERVLDRLADVEGRGRYVAE